MIFDIAIALYKYDRNNKYTKLFLFNNLKEDTELVLINYHNNDRSFWSNIRNSCIIKDLCIFTELIKINLKKKLTQ